MATKSTKTERLLASLKEGNEISVAQAINRFGFTSASAVSSAVRNLREDGYAVYTNNVRGTIKYRIGTPSRRIVAAGYRLLGAEALGG